MPHMNEVMNLLEETLYPLKVVVTFNNDIPERIIQDFEDLTKRIEQTLMEHKALQVGHLARS